MKKIFFLAALAFASMMQAKTVTLDVNAPLNPETITYDGSGVWAETYNEDDYAMIDYQSMSFSHVAWTDWNFWYGFTIAKCQDTTYSVMEDQFHCVAGGGLAGKGTPYLLAYAAEGMSAEPPCEVFFDAAYTPQEVSLCIGSWALHNVTIGGAGHTFAAGDSLVIEIEGLDENYEVIEGKKVTFFLADYRSANESDWKLNQGWEACDLTALGEVYGLAFTMKTSDVGSYGSNTALYFALDGLKIANKVADFEDVEIPATESVLHLTQTGDIQSGSFHFTQEVADYGDWGIYYFGNLPSNKSDNIYESNLDAEKSVSGGAYEGNNFMVWTSSYAGQDGIALNQADVVPGFMLNNTAYAVSSMCNGDSFAKKFGADDWFKLTITGSLNGVDVNTQVIVDLAAAGEYINQWTYVDLSTLGEVDAIRFALTSSDTGASGMNTPAYFCMDNFGAEKPAGYVEPERAKFGDTEAVENVETGVKAFKVLRNGQLIIVRGESEFTVTGQSIKE